MELVSWPPDFLDWHDLSANFHHARRLNPVEITTINKALDGTRSRFCWSPPPVLLLSAGEGRRQRTAPCSQFW